MSGEGEALSQALQARPKEETAKAAACAATGNRVRLSIYAPRAPIIVKNMKMLIPRPVAPSGMQVLVIELPAGLKK
jgi:hypothetical protein